MRGRRLWIACAAALAAAAAALLAGSAAAASLCVGSHAGCFATIEAVQIVNPTTIRIVTKKPDPLLLVRVAQMGAQILPARLTTDEGVRYMAIPGRGSGGNAEVEARWAAEFDVGSDRG